MPSNTYWNNHLRQVYDFASSRLFVPMVEASRAHVAMLAERGLVARVQAARLLRGLETLRDPGPTPPFDGAFEDVYYMLEQQLAEAMEVPTSDLDVQLARSRNDLDAGVFRWTIREDLLVLGELVVAEARECAGQATATADALVVGFTHRRPAQPTTIGHVLSGLIEARLSLLKELVEVYDEVNVSPLGSAAFAGTDLAIDACRVADLLGFDRTFRSSYDAVAGAEHLFRPAALYARYGATSARFARTLLDWMTRGWIETPDEFTQGSSIMPQKRNPVVLEHLCSYAGAAAADLAATANNIGVAWFEDSNNATTDVQPPLARAADRAARTARIMCGLLRAFAVRTLPTPAEIVASGATTTMVAEELARQGLAWRAAHGVVHDMLRQGEPTQWTAESISNAVHEAGFAPLSSAESVLAAAIEPVRVLRRTQAGSPGVTAVRDAVGAAVNDLDGVAEQLARRRQRLTDAATRLDAAIEAILAV